MNDTQSFVRAKLKGIVINFFSSKRATQRYSVKKSFLIDSQNSQENTPVGISSVIKMQV